MARVDINELVKGLKLLQSDVDDIKAEDIPSRPGMLWKLTHLEPAIYSGLVTAVVAILAAVGFAIADDKVTSLVSIIGVIAGIVQALWTRSKSTPNAKVVVFKPDPISAANTVAAGPAVSTNIVAVANAAAAVNSSDLPLIPEGL